MENTTNIRKSPRISVKSTITKKDNTVFRGSSQ